MVCCSNYYAAEGFDMGNDFLQAMKDVVKNGKNQRKFLYLKNLMVKGSKLNYFEKLIFLLNVVQVNTLTMQVVSAYH